MNLFAFISTDLKFISAAGLESILSRHKLFTPNSNGNCTVAQEDDNIVAKRLRLRDSTCSDQPKKVLSDYMRRIEVRPGEP